MPRRSHPDARDERKDPGGGKVRPPRSFRLERLALRMTADFILSRVRNDRPSWNSVHCVRAFLDEEPLEGLWFDRTKEYLARNRGQSFGAFQFASPETVVLEPLPCWSDLPKESVRERVAQLVEKIESAAAKVREETRIQPLDANEIRAQHPHHRPARSKKSPAPLFHAFRRRVRRELYEAYHQFAQAFRIAAEKLKAGDRHAQFPLGSFPPPLPFVAATG